MPRYNYKCDKCGLIQEFERTYERRDQEMWHSGSKDKPCHGNMIRTWEGVNISLGNMDSNGSSR